MKTLYTTYNNFAKRLVMSLMVLMTVGVGSVLGETATFTWGTKPLAYTKESSSFSEGQVTFTGTKGTGSIPTRAWTDGLRMYAGGTAQFSVPDGYVITKIEGYTTFNFNNATGQQTVLFTGLSKATCSTDVTVTYQSSGYTITYNTNGGTAVSPTTGTKLPNPLPTTTKTGYTFAGWFTNSNLTTAAVAGATISSNTTLYAKWTANKYAVKFNGNGNTGGSMNDQSFTYGTAQNLTPNAFEKYGYNFAGWAKTSNGSVAYTDGQSVSNLTSTNNATVNLYAKWTEKDLTNYRTTCTEPSTFTVTYNANDATSGSVPEDNTEYAKDAQVIVLGNTGNLAKTGYTFSGWNTEADGSGNNYAAGATFSITENTTLYAQWKANTYTITLNTNGGTINSGAISSYTYGVGATLPTDVTKTGYTFAGWYNHSDFTGDPIKTIGTTETGNKEFWAKWTPAVYTINYKDQGDVAFSGTHEEGYPTTHTYNTATTLKSASKDHYTFGGWYKESDCSGTKVTILGATEYTDNITLYAKWTAKTYTITFNAGTGECGTESVTTTNAEGVELPTAAHTCTDWTFAGWWTEEVSSTNTSPGTLMKAGDTYKPASNITLYAVYSTEEAGDAFTGYAKVTEAPDDWSGKYLLSTGTYTATGAYDANGANGHLVRTTYTPGTDEKAEWEFTLAKVDVDGNTVGYSILFPDGSFYLGYASSTNFQRSIDDPSENEAYLWTPSISGISNVYATTRKIADNGSADFRPYSSPSSSNIVYLYKRVGGGSTTIYNSNPTCLVPVWEGATIDKTALTVNCGERSPMTGANGAAKITFSAEKIYNFTKDITIEATTGFLVSTSQSVDANYQSSVSLSPLVGTTNANTFYDKFVYVRAEAPAMLEEDLSGTITIKNNKGETLQTFSVTADVTCAQYTLTLVDRGVSTEQPTKYYAGETIDEALADPEGVCTDPIHYVFDGWAETTVTNGSTGYTPVSFPYTVTGNTKFYAVYRYLEGGGNGDYNLVTSALDDWSGDYLIAYSDQIFANGKIGGKDGIGAAGEKVDLSSYITNNTIPAAEGDKYKVSLEAINGGYLLKTQDGKYNYQSSNTNGLEATTNKNTATNYKLSVNFVSSEEINLCLSGNALGAIFQYNTDQQGYFRFYKNGGQQPVYLYKKADGTTYYTTSPVCGPHLAITEGKDIYVTGGNAGGTRDLVIAQTKVSYKATRLEKDKSTGNLPSIKALPSNIVFDNTKTKAVAVTFDEDSVRTLQSDGTYTITGNITIAYQPAAANVTDDIQVTLNANYNPSADVSQASFTVHARSLPSEFVIVAKSGDKWYALNGDMANGSSANPANGQVTLNDDANPTKATYAPCNTIYTFDGLPNTGDRTYVRFQGTDGAWLWASSGNNVGIQNNVLKTTPEGSNKAYNWKLYTEDNITYRFGNANSSRQLTLSGEKFGMYASGVQDIRILPYEAKCLYNYAPSNLKVSVLKGTYVTLTWDAVAGATKYQYRTNGTTWTDCGTEPTVTINGLTGATKYTYYIRAYHEDAGVSQECIDYAEITFTTADCDDVPTDISFAAGIYSITLYWQCAAEKSTVILYSDEAGTQAIKTITDAKSPLTIDDLDKVTTYYAKILAGGICASPLTTVSTAPPAVDVVEWKTEGMDVYVNTDDEIIVSLEGEVYEGSGSGNVATELFFSKYFEATGNVKLLALFNGTGQDIDLSTYSIKFSAKGADYTGATTTEEVKYDNTIELSEDIPDDRLILPAGKELIMISYPTSGAAGAVSITNPDGTTIKIDSKDAAILECAANNSQESGWDDYVRVTSPLLNFSGNDAVALFKGDQLVDIIGAGNTTNVNMSKVVAASTNPSFMDAAGWYNANGYQIQPDGTIGTTNNYPLSTNRCLLIRRNTVINGDNAVLKNTTDFVTLGGQESEWMGYQIPDGNGACEGFEYVGKYDYANYYTTYDKVGEDQTFESGSRNPDGTVPVYIPEIGKYSCKNLKITVKDEEQVLVVQEFKVPIIVAKNQETNGEVFTALKTTLGTVIIDQNGTPTGEIEPLTDEEWIEECKECDIVVRNNATLTHVKTGLNQFRDLTIYPTGKLSNIESNLAVNRLMIQAENDQVGYAIIEKGEGSITANAIAHTKRIDAQYWYAFSLPYDCNINEITQANGESMGEYGVHWGIQYYDGKRRQQEGTSANLGQSSKFWLPMGPNDKLNAYQGYLIALFDASVQKPTDMRTIYFPPAEENTYTESGSDSKQTNVYSWNVNLTCEKRHHGWNFTGTPYISMFNPVAAGITDADLSNVLMTGTWDPVENEYEENEHVYVSIPTPNGGKYYNQHLASTKELLPFMAYFVQTSDPTTDDETKQLTYAKGGRELPAAAPARAAATAQRVLVELLVTAPDGQTDNTGVWVDENYVPEYELAADLTKMYVAGEKPQLYTLAANNEKMAYNALPDGAATNIPLGLYAPIAGDYNLSLNERMSRIAGAESVELIYNNAVVANLLFQDYTITANKGNVNGYSLCIRRRANVTTAVDNVTGSVITMIVNDGYISVLGVPTDATVYVYDMVGHLMEMQSANGNTVVNMPSVPQGVYNIVITNDKGSTTIKSFVK